LFSHTSENNSIKKTLEQANLSGADLSGADLSGADLIDAYLRGAVLPIFNKWSTSVNLEKQTIQIGCKEMNIEQWDSFFNSNNEFSTPRSDESFKFIHANYLALKAYLEFLTKATTI